MNAKKITAAIALIEILIGLVTFLGLVASKVISVSQKPLNVFMFVLLTSVISFVLGLGIMSRRNWARQVLIFFSGYIILTKIFIFSGLLHFAGDMFTVLPGGFKNSISLIYHILVILILTYKPVRETFESA